MEYINRRGHDFSKLSLGTVQLGLNYGISNVNGKPSRATSREIIDAAMDAGITTLDTSETYGTAEDEIGEYFNNRTSRPNPIVVTKFKIGISSSYTAQRLRHEISQSIHSSLRRLRLKKIPVYLFHKDKDQQLNELIDPLSIVMNELKAEGLIDIAGISAYGPADVDAVLDHDILEAVQIPVNIFDQRLINTGKLNQLEKQNKIVFARSVFLQGLVFMKSEELPEKLHGAKKYLDKLGKIAQSTNLTVPQLSFSFVKDIRAVTSIVFGALSREQVDQNVAYLNTPALQPSTTESIREAFADVPELIITPGLW